MKCDICKREILYNASEQFYIVSKYEMIYGEQSIYPFQVEKELICADCLSNKEVPNGTTPNSNI
jgi:hypothetical protein